MGRTKKKQTREEKLEKKRLAEKRRLEKIKSDPQLYEEFKAKDRARYYKKKEQKKVLPMNELTPRRQRIQRKRNRDNFKAYYTRQKTQKRIDTLLRQDSPPESDNELPPQLVPECSHRLTRRNLISEPASPFSSRSSNSSIVSKSTFRKYQYKKTKIIQTLQRKVIELQKEKDTLRKQAHRLKNSNNRPENISEDKGRPLKKSVSKAVSKIQKLRLDIQKFLTDDENSRLCPGKKDCVTKNKIKHQKRYLNDTLQNLHQKFLSTHQYKIHYGTFCKLRPFWILNPTISIRDTCLCKVHDNIALVIASLRNNKVITENNTTEVLNYLTCDRNNVNCLQKKCPICRNRVISYQEFDDSKIITYNSWENKKQTFIKKGVEKEITIIEKVKISKNPRDVIRKFEQDLTPFMNHCAKIVNQSFALKNTKEKFKNEECVLHIDYSENYNCKLGTEIQSMHFGGSRKQITLHTAVLYYHEENTGEKKTKSICTLSKCLRHDASAVWAHLVPLLKFIEENCPQIRSIHIFSDSPSFQYRNRKIFYIISKLSWYLPDLKSVTWNYSECGHGKGAPDGVGGVLKRTADKHVSFGNDISNLDDFVQILKEKVDGVLLEVIDEYNILEKDMLLPPKLPVFSGTLKVHQAVWNSQSRNSVTLRTLTCIHEDCFSKASKCYHNKHLGLYKIVDPENPKTQVNPNKKIKVLSEIVFCPGLIRPTITRSSGGSNALASSSSLDYDDANASDSENYNQDSLNDKENIPVKLGSWILVKFKTYMGVKQFVASVVDIRLGDYHVIFLDHIDGSMYKWPDHSDTDTINIGSIVRVLEEPTFQLDDHIDGLLYKWPDQSDTDTITISSIFRVQEKPTFQLDDKIMFKSLI